MSRIWPRTAAAASLVVAGAGAAVVVGWPVLRMVSQAIAAVATTGVVPGLGRTLAVSLALAVVVTVIGTAVGLALALTARTLSRGWRRVLDATIGGLLLVPPYVVAAAVVAVGGRGGLLTGILPDVYGALGMTLAMVVAHLPIPYLTIRMAWREVDPRLVEMSRVTGARAAEVIRLVLLPPLRVPLAVSTALLVVSALSDPSIPAVLRGRMPTLAHTAYIEVIAWGGESTAALIAVLLTLPVLPLLLAMWRRREAGALVDPWQGHGASPRLVLPRSILVHGCRVLSVLVLAVVLLLMLASAATMIRARGSLLTPTMMDVIGSTVRYALVALGLAVPVGLMTAWASDQGGTRLARGVDLLQTSLLLMPGTTLGIAIFLAYGFETPTPFGQLPALVGGASLASGSVALVAVFMAPAVPMVHLAARAGQRRAPRALHETAKVLGAGRRRITLQLVVPQTGALVAATAAAVAARNIVSVTPVVFVSTPDAPMVASFALDLLDRAALEQTFALTGIVALLVGGASALVASASVAALGARARSS
ncbi:ABC transporter permease [Brachybacterium tyrofermentans]|uniref:ABC transporter permease n=1 Tax=Brachybacterium tyrofermentans TaxID=47848 RepID=A0ABW0FLW2_9MICO